MKPYVENVAKKFDTYFVLKMFKKKKLLEMPQQETVSEWKSFGGADSTVPKRNILVRKREREPDDDMNVAKSDLSR